MRSFIRLLGYLKPYRWRILLGLVCLLLSTPASLFHPLVWKYVVDEVILGHKSHLLLPAIGVMLLVHYLGIALSSLRAYILGVVGQRFVFDLRNELNDRIQSHSMQFFHDRRSGDLIARTIGDVDTLQDVAIEGVDKVISNALQFVAVSAIIVVLNWKVGTLTLVPMLGVGAMVWLFNARVRGLYRRIRDRLGDLSAKFQENLLGMLIIKAFAREAYEMQRFQAVNRQYLTEGVKGVTARNLYFPTVFAIGFVSNAIMVGAGAYYVIQGEFTLGALVAYRGYWWSLFAPVLSLAQTNEMLQRAFAASGRIFEVFDAPLEIADDERAKELIDPQGHLVCDGVSFSYDDRREILRDVELEVRPGEKLGVVGPSGGGKSTILSMLLRLYDPKTGAIRIDGNDLRRVTQRSLRGHLAIVTQEPFLFNETVRSNILYGRPDATPDELVQAARLANAEEFIDRLPDGYDTLVGERGVKLSGGQKQRLCIARAFLANPRVLLLDEATAAVEPESEAIIQSALWRLMEGRTAVIVSHRLSMVRDTDLIVVVDGGRVTERGTHDELMAAEGWYARMYRLQMGELGEAA
ncbi:MAG: ABC transporter ATP-binding protein [Phycisphaerae bacterium]|nr:ABC transporter ATP-binding protein [Phycisphaerae bacterium]